MADGHNVNHDYHIIDPSPWPLIGSIGGLVTAIGAIAWMRSLAEGEFVVAGANLAAAGPWIFYIGIALILYTMYAWWADTVKESHQGHHTKVVSLHLRYGMLLFIASEVMFFVAWFWAFFDASLFPGWHLPLFNTVILLLSGTTVTWAHHALIEDDRKTLKWMLFITVALGVFFSYVQAYEYQHAPFTFSESIYGATFFMATGFHGFHVLVGTIFLAVCLFRAMAGHFTPQKHFGFEAAAWYWHFVDVVWLFLFCAIYVWASAGATIAAH